MGKQKCCYDVKKERRGLVVQAVCQSGYKYLQVKHKVYQHMVTGQTQCKRS